MLRFSSLKLRQILLLVVIILEFSCVRNEVLYENDPCERPYPGACVTEKNCPGLEATIGRLYKTAKDVGSCGVTAYEELICCPTEALAVEYGLVTLPPNEPTKRATTGTPTGHLARKACEDLRLQKYAGPQIFSGETVRPGEYPHMAALLSNTSKVEVVCGGTLIDKRFVLTAAHCLNKKIGDVVFGVTNFTSKLQLRAMKRYSISNKTPHSKYTAANPGMHDIAIIELNEDVQFSGEIYPACLHTDMSDFSDHTLVNITGFGSISDRKKKSSKLLYAAVVEIVAVDRCNSLLMKSGVLERSESTQLCTLDPNEEFGKSTCVGDSGGALTQLLNSEYNKHMVVGVIGGAHGCGSSVPSINAGVAQYIDFIEKVVWPHKENNLKIKHKNSKIQLKSRKKCNKRRTNFKTVESTKKSFDVKAYNQHDRQLILSKIFHSESD